jgi:hypothetical protein
MYLLKNCSFLGVLQCVSIQIYCINGAGSATAAIPSMVHVFGSSWIGCMWAGAVVEVEIGGSFPQRNRPYYGGKFCLLTPRVFLLYLLDIVLMYLGPRM